MSEHGTIGRYQAGCREACCRRAKKADRIERERLIAAGHAFSVPCDRSRRKVRALAALGWGFNEVGARMSITQQAISRILLRDTIRATTAERIDEVYRDLEMAIPPDNIYTRRTKNKAAREGWLPPLAYDDIDAGIVATLAGESGYSHDRLDLDLVEDVMQYHDFDVKLSPREKAEVVHRWTKDGRSERSLCALTGWREGRYRRKPEEAR